MASGGLAMDGTLTDRVVVVFGGSSGIGLATARRAHAEGASVRIIGRNVAKLELAAQSMPGAQWRAAEVRDADAVAKALADLDSIDHVFVSTGQGGSSDALASSMEEIRLPFEERVFGTFNVLRAAAPKMTNGSITLMSGMNASRLRRGASAQTAALCAVEGLARALALDLAPIRVNAIAPGWIDTPRLDRLYGKDKPDRILAIAAQLPGKRLGYPAEVAHAVIMLMTVEYMNGEVLHIDGAGRYA
jgi:NAD(P)-dependent dehydrogenase (short-subunit alcohol dehydrogenase family)